MFSPPKILFRNKKIVTSSAWTLFQMFASLLSPRQLTRWGPWLLSRYRPVDWSLQYSYLATIQYNGLNATDEARGGSHLRWVHVRRWCSAQVKIQRQRQLRESSRRQDFPWRIVLHLEGRQTSGSRDSHLHPLAKAHRILASATSIDASPFHCMYFRRRRTMHRTFGVDGSRCIFRIDDLHGNFINCQLSSP